MDDKEILEKIRELKLNQPKLIKKGKFNQAKHEEDYIKYLKSFL